jgi:hypothetical protein
VGIELGARGSPVVGASSRYRSRGQDGSTRRTSSRYCSGSIEWSRQVAMIVRKAAVPNVSLMEPGSEVIFSLMEPPDFQGHGATCKMG